MKTFLIVAGAAVGAYVLWRAVHAVANGVSPVAAILRPSAPIAGLAMEAAAASRRATTGAGSF